MQKRGHSQAQEAGLGLPGLGADERQSAWGSREGVRSGGQGMDRKQRGARIVRSGVRLATQAGTDTRNFWGVPRGTLSI